MGCWEAWGGFQADPGFERKSDPSPIGTCQSVRVMLVQIDLVLELGGFTNAWFRLCKLSVVIVSCLL